MRHASPESISNKFIVLVASGLALSVLGGAGVLVGLPTRCAADEGQALCADNGLAYVFFAMFVTTVSLAATAIVAVLYLCWTRFTPALNARIAKRAALLSLIPTAITAFFEVPYRVLTPSDSGRLATFPFAVVGALAAAAVMASILLLPRRGTYFFLCTTTFAILLLVMGWYLFLPAAFFVALATVMAVSGVAALAAQKGQRSVRV